VAEQSEQQKAWAAYDESNRPDEDVLRDLVAELKNALAGMVGLIQLISNRDDITDECRVGMQHNHRYEEAVRLISERKS
jgi:nitrogen-specific signal transduction histidine kinase